MAPDLIPQTLGGQRVFRIQIFCKYYKGTTLHKSCIVNIPKGGLGQHPVVKPINIFYSKMYGDDTK